MKAQDVFKLIKVNFLTHELNINVIVSMDDATAMLRNWSASTSPCEKVSS